MSIQFHMDEPYYSIFKPYQQFRIQLHLQSIDNFQYSFQYSCISEQIWRKEIMPSGWEEGSFRSLRVPEKCHGKLITGNLKVFARDKNRKLHKNIGKLSEDQLQITSDIYRAWADEAVLKKSAVSSSLQNKNINVLMMSQRSTINS